MDRPFAFFTLVSVIVHILVIIFLPGFGWQEIEIYPVEYREALELHEAPASPPAKPPGRPEPKPVTQVTQPPRPSEPKPEPKPEKESPKSPEEAPSKATEAQDMRVITTKEEGKEAVVPPVGEARGPSLEEPASPPSPITTQPGPEAPPAQPPGEDYGSGESLVLSSTIPVYPKGAQNEGIEGEVRLDAAVSGDGSLSKLTITQSSGERSLDEIARRVIEAGWTFKAIGKPYSLKILVSFKNNRVSLGFLGVKLDGQNPGDEARQEGR